MSHIEARQKIFPLSELEELLAKRRANGQTVVLTNGAFDMLHVGHLRYLQDAARYGDILVVAVNSDSSVKLSKGPSRPIIPVAERAELVAALEGVDYVVIFNEKSVSEVIKALRPNFHAKGTDYTADSVPEAELVRSLGGQVIITGDPKEHSSTQIVEKLHTANNN